MVHRKSEQPRAVAGFTLIEVLVVVVMIGVVAAIAAPSWASFLNRQRMNAVRSDLIGVLRNAQDEAESRQQSRRVSLSSANLSVTVQSKITTTPSGNTTVLGSGNTSKLRMTASSTSFVFDPNGRVWVNTAGSTPLTTPLATPFVISINNVDNPSSSSQSCVIVTTLLGGLKPANNEMCNSFNSSPR